MTYDHDQLHDDISHLQSTLDNYITSQGKLRHRVDNIYHWKVGIDRVLFGDKRSDGVGLVQAARESSEMVAEWRQLKRAFLVFAVPFTAATAGLFANLVWG